MKVKDFIYDAINTDIFPITNISITSAERLREFASKYNKDVVQSILDGQYYLISKEGKR